MFRAGQIAGWVLALLCLAQSARAQVIINPRDLNVDLPGASKGKISAYWLAPYVRVSTETIGKRNATIVTWYGENGEIKRATEVQSVQPGYLTRISRQIPAFLAENRWAAPYLSAHEFRTVLQGVNEDWRLTFPSQPWGRDYVTATSDSRVLLYQSWQTTNGTTALSVYIHGNLVTNVGPYGQYRGESVQLGDDGSAAMVISKDGSPSSAQVLVFGPDGQIRFRVDCESGVTGAIPGPEGSGVLLCSAILLPLAGYEKKYQWYTKDGKSGTLDCGTNAWFANWIPGSHKAVFDTSVGDDHRYRLVDWDTTKMLWEFPCPTNSHVLAIGCLTNYVVFGVAELHNGPVSGAPWDTIDNAAWFRCFYAVNISDGKIAARWNAPYPKPFSLQESQKFARLHGKLYYFTPDEFCEIREDEIAAKTNHWWTGGAWQR